MNRIIEASVHFIDVVASRGIPATITLILALALFRWVLHRQIKHQEKLSDELKLRWTNIVKNTSYLVLVISLVLIWAPQIQTFALSLTAFAVAIVIATKELILCFSGTILRMSSRPFSIGDIIESGDYLGYVVDQNFLTTTLKELEPDFYSATGKTLIIPNSLFLSAGITNHSFIRPYMIHSFNVYLEPNARQVNIYHNLLSTILEEYWSSFQQENPKFLAQIRGKRLIQQDALPKVRFTTNDGAKHKFVVTFPCRAEARLEQEQAILKRLFATEIQ
ncbi:mechanosensitive ion channel family protein [Gynuella sp.]|uniref:mechanosensitive ion channel family protein n=1 Tax=Gynuella sp. TaxID=2969146 RepID=UPI003D10FB32